MDAFLESMQSRILGVPTWIWGAAVLAVCFYLGAELEPGRTVDAGGDACGAFFGGRNC
jgi:hypothetical protein